MNDSCNSLLDDGILSVRVRTGEVKKYSLPSVLHALSTHDLRSFEALQSHQRQAWYCFLVQLAAMVRSRIFVGETPAEEADWRHGLVTLGSGVEEMWRLVVPDVSKPAFLQTPIPEGSLEAAKYKQDIETPDELDVLVTSKNHDVKITRIIGPRAEHWVYALVTLQTMEGVLGRGNYGVIRMNSGYGNRPFLGLSPGLSWATRFRRDVEALVEERASSANQHLNRKRCLLWDQPWDGNKGSGIPLTECDRLFIEVCRRIRFTMEPDKNGGFRVWRANTDCQRVGGGNELKGVTGDPWTPVRRAEAVALTVGGSGFKYDLLHSVLFEGDFRHPSLLQARNEEKKGAFVVATALARGQGGTEGLHNRFVYIPRLVSTSLFGDTDDRERLSRRSARWVSLVATTKTKILYPALAALHNRGLDGRGKVEWSKVSRWTDALDRSADAQFFETLWDTSEMGDEEAGSHWSRLLYREAEILLLEAERSTPVSGLHRWRALSKARSIFHSQARKELPLAFDDNPGGEEAPERRENENHDEH